MMVKMMATNSVIANYQEIVDISTTPGKVGIFGIHTPDTIKPVQMLRGFYNQFRQFRYLGCDVKIQPAATLPADPLGVSYEAGEVATDPRDLLNPIMVKGCHGETINQALDIAYRDNSSIGDSLTKSEWDMDGSAGESSAYYSALSDPTFRKYSVLQPFGLRNLHPLVHKMVGTLPIFPKQSSSAWDVALTGLDEDSELDYYDPVSASGTSLQIPGGVASRVGYYSNNGPLEGSIFTSSMERLGWLDTVSRPQSSASYNARLFVEADSSAAEAEIDWLVTGGPEGSSSVNYRYNSVPKLFMSLLIMPPCYKTILSFRMVISHRFAFRGFRSAILPTTSTQAYTDDLNAVATTNASVPATTSVETLNGTSAPITDGVY